MPTVLRIGSLRVVIYPDDHLPPHVIGPDSQAVFNLPGPDLGLELRESHGFRTGELRRIAAAIEVSLSRLQAEWERIHGYQR